MIDFQPTEEQRLLQSTVRDYAREKLWPRAPHLDETGEFPWPAWREMGELGLLGMAVPQEYGGAGMSTVDYVLALEEVCWGCASTGVAMSVQNSLVEVPILKFGTEAQKSRYLPGLASGERVGCYCLTEPGSGSDAVAMKATCVKKGDRWILNGVKQFITNGPQADVAVVYATLDPALRSKGVCAFIVEKGFPGYRVGKVEHKMGLKGSSTSEILLEDCEVPEENLLGQEGRGFTVAMATLDGGRIGIATQAVGIARAAFDEALRYSQERKAFDQPIANFQAIQWKLADMATRIDASRLLIHRAARLRDQGENHSVESAMAKVFSSETAVWATNHAVQVHGGYGYIREFAVERLYRDAKICDLYEGTSEIQRLVVATNILKGNYRGAGG